MASATAGLLAIAAVVASNGRAVLSQMFVLDAHLVLTNPAAGLTHDATNAAANAISCLVIILIVAVMLLKGPSQWKDTMMSNLKSHRVDPKSKITRLQVVVVCHSMPQDMPDISTAKHDIDS